MTKSTAVGIIIAITFWWLWFLGMVGPSPTQPFIFWAVDEPMGIWLEDPYQTQVRIKMNELENQQAKEFFQGFNRDPFQRLVYRRETI